MTPSSDPPASVTGDSEEDARVPTALPDDAIVPGASRQPPTLPMRKRPRPGERRVQILETLATMLQEPGAERVTTAALAAKLDVSEAAGSTTPTVEANAEASALTAFAVGRLQRFARSGFKKSPTEHLDVALRLFAP